MIVFIRNKFLGPFVRLRGGNQEKGYVMSTKTVSIILLKLKATRFT